MPGIYINDGGATSSALGNMLGGIAANLGPEAAAKAQLLRLQAEEADRQNWLLSNTQQGALAIPGVLNAPGVNADPTAAPAASPTVAGTLASAATPPAAPQPSTAFGTRDQTAGFSPFARVVAGSYSKDPSMSNLLTGINLGRDATQGPGSDYTTQAEIAKSRATPQAVTSGTKVYLDPSKGDAPGNVLSGPSSYESTVATTTGASNPASAEHDISQGADATVNLGKAQGIQKLYDMVVAPESTPGGIFTEGVAKNIADYLGIPVDRILQMSVPGVKAEIRARFASMVSNLRDNLGQPMFKGGLDQIMSQFPDPDLDPTRFRSAMTTLTTTLQQQAADGQAAMEYYKHPTPEAYVALLQRKAANAANAKAAFATIGVQDKTEGGGGGGSGGGGGGGGSGGGEKPKFQLVPDIPTGMKLPSGTLFRTPDGKPYKVP